MPKRIVIWSPAARAQLRAIDRETARQILQAIDRYLDTGAGDVIKLQPPRPSSACVSATTAYASTTTAQPSPSSASATAAKPTANHPDLQRALAR